MGGVLFGWLIRKSPGRGWPWHGELSAGVCAPAWAVFTRASPRKTPVSKIRDAVDKLVPAGDLPLSASSRGLSVITSPIRTCTAALQYTSCDPLRFFSHAVAIFGAANGGEHGTMGHPPGSPARPNAVTGEAREDRSLCTRRGCSRKPSLEVGGKTSSVKGHCSLVSAGSN